MSTRPKLFVAELVPDFARELAALVCADGRPDLAAQLPGLVVMSRCTCGDKNCAHFYTAPRPDGSYGAGHTNVMLSSKTGLVVLDLLGTKIVAVEVLDRPDVKGPLDEYLPL
jgi:hypothetical protein